VQVNRIRSRPGREQNLTALRARTEILFVRTSWIAATLPVLGDLSYEGEAATISVAVERRNGGEFTEDQKSHNNAHNGKRGRRRELKITFQALRNTVLVWHHPGPTTSTVGRQTPSWRQRQVALLSEIHR
jgi:hypothetical protein